MHGNYKLKPGIDEETGYDTYLVPFLINKTKRIPKAKPPTAVMSSSRMAGISAENHKNLA